MPMEAMQDLGARIRQVRGKVSQEEFARRLGISKGALGCYERGVNCPNVEVVLGICRLCRVSVEWLVAGSGPMMAPPPREAAPEQEQPLTVQAVSAPVMEAEGDDAGTAVLLRRHCAWLQQRLDAMEDERRDLNRENRLLWQRTADLGRRLARLELDSGPQEDAPVHAGGAGEDGGDIPPRRM